MSQPLGFFLGVGGIMIAGNVMELFFPPVALNSNNSCYFSTVENRWQFANQDEQVNIDCSRSAFWLTPAARSHAPETH